MHAVRAMENVLASLAHGKVDFTGKRACNLKITDQSSNGLRLNRNIDRRPALMA